MTDVRLTAVNPEDSQVYPVACNDKGELLLDAGGASGDLDVTGTLTVAGSATFASELKTLDQLTVNSPTTNANAYILALQSAVGGANTLQAYVLADGSAEFAGNNKTAGTSFISKTSGGYRHNLIDGGYYINNDANNVSTIALNADGSASFAGNIASNASIFTTRFGNKSQLASTETISGNTRQFAFAAKNSSTYKITADYEGNVSLGNNAWSSPNIILNGESGSATFAGDVTAPNITFKIAPATAATMPAPLIDEGFVANNQVDLLTELIKMKLQIRDLNAFMQRTLQDENQTTQ